MLDTSTARVANEEREISDVGRIRSLGNIADGLTNLAKCRAVTELLDFAKLTTTVEQWVIRQSLTERTKRRQ